MSDPSLITTMVWYEHTYLVKLNSFNNYLEISIVDQHSGEEWQCSYDHLYVEHLTHKTGNFKPFDTFMTMLKTGLLKTRECIQLDLLTYDDLESLRIRRFKTQTNLQNSSNQNANRRYLILTYNADFDRISYPLALEYCGPPDPQFLQATIKRLESELVKTRNEASSKESNRLRLTALKNRIEQLETENHQLRQQLRFQSCPVGKVEVLQNAISQLESSVISERKSHHKLVERMRNEKVQLMKTNDLLKRSETSLKLQLSNFHSMKRFDCGDSFGSKRSMKTLFRRSRSNSLESVKTEPVHTKLLSPSENSLFAKEKIKRQTSKRRSRRDVKNTSTSSLCSSNISDNNPKSVSRYHSRSSSVESTSSSKSKPSSKTLKCQLRSRNASVPIINQDKLNFNALEKKVSQLQKLLTIKSVKSR